MTLPTLSLSPGLAQAVSESYEAGLYSKAIQDGFIYLTGLLRERGDIDADGVALVDKLLSPKDPILKLGDLTTEDGRNLQSGYHQTLRGLYIAIRNPRAHSQHRDSPEQAAAILVFLDFVIKAISLAAPVFDIDAFFETLLDRNFSEKPRYSQLLVEKIPPKRRLEVFTRTLKSFTAAADANFVHFIPALYAVLTSDEQEQSMRALSDLLAITADESIIRIAIRCFGMTSSWVMLEEATRLRIGHILLKSIKVGSQAVGGTTGSLGTWVHNMPHLIEAADLLSALQKKMLSGSESERMYVANYFGNTLINDRSEATKDALNQAILQLSSAAYYLCADHPHWRSELKETLVYYEGNILPF